MNDSLKSDNLLYQGHLHWIIFLWPALLIVVGGYIEYYWHSLGFPLILVGGVWECYSVLLYFSSSIQITNNFIIVQNGILVRKTLTVSLQQLESVDVTQNILGSIFNYGNLSVRGTGGTSAFFSPMAHPLTCRRFIETR